MKFNLPLEDASESLEFREAQVGDVYPAKGGYKTKYWVVLAVGKSGKVEGRGAIHLIGLNDDGEITAMQTYGRHAIEGTKDGLFKPRKLLGHVKGLDDLQFDVELFEE